MPEDKTQQIWSFTIDIDPVGFWIRYYYVMKNERQSTMVWERGPGRVVQASDFRAQTVQ